jgi:methionyl-tRNA synthetase
MQTELSTYWQNIAKRMRAATNARLKGNIQKALNIESELDATYERLTDEARIKFERYEDKIRNTPR